MKIFLIIWGVMAFWLLLGLVLGAAAGGKRPRPPRLTRETRQIKKPERRLRERLRLFKKRR